MPPIEPVELELIILPFDHPLLHVLWEMDAKGDATAYTLAQGYPELASSRFTGESVAA